MKITQTWMDISDTQKSVLSGRTTKRGGGGGAFPGRPIRKQEEKNYEKQWKNTNQ